MGDSTFLVFLNKFINRVPIEEPDPYNFIDPDDVIETAFTLDAIDEELDSEPVLENEFLSLLEAKGGGSMRMRQKVPTAREKSRPKQDKGKFEIANQPGHFQKPTLVKGEKSVFQRKQWRAQDEGGGGEGEHGFDKALDASMKKDLDSAMKKGAKGEKLFKSMTSLLDSVKMMREKLNASPEVRDSIMRQLVRYRQQGVADKEAGKGTAWLDASERTMLMMGQDIKAFYPKEKLQERYDALATAGSGQTGVLHSEMLNRVLDRHNIPREFLLDPKGWEAKNGRLEDFMKVPKVAGETQQQGQQKQEPTAQQGQQKEPSPETNKKLSSVERLARKMAMEFNKKNPENQLNVDKVVSGIVKQAQHREGYKTKQDLQNTIDQQHKDLVASKDQTIQAQGELIKHLTGQKVVIGQKAANPPQKELVQKSIEAEAIASKQRKAAKLDFEIKNKPVRSSVEKRRKWNAWTSELASDANAFVDGTIDPSRVEKVLIPGKEAGVFHEVSYLKRREGEEGIAFKNDAHSMKFVRLNKHGQEVKDIAPGGEDMLPIKLTVNLGTDQARTLTAATNGRMGVDRGEIVFKQGHVLNEMGQPINKAHIASLTGWAGVKDTEAWRYYDQKKKENKVLVREAQIAVRGKDGQITGHKTIPIKAQSGGNIEHNMGFQPLGGMSHAEKVLGLDRRSAKFFATAGKKLLHGDMQNGVGFYLDHTGQIAPEITLASGQSMPIDSAMRKRMEGAVGDAMKVADKAIRAAQGLGLKHAKDWAGLSAVETMRRWDEWKSSGGLGSEKASHLNLAKKMIGYAASLRYMMDKGTARNIDDVAMELKGGKKYNPARNLQDLGARIISTDPLVKKELGGRFQSAEEGGPLKILRDKRKAELDAAQGIVKKEGKKKEAKATVEKKTSPEKEITIKSKVSPEEHEDFVNSVNAAKRGLFAPAFMGGLIETISHKLGRDAGNRVKNYLAKVGSIVTKMGGHKAIALAEKTAEGATTSPNFSGGINGSFIMKFKDGTKAIGKADATANVAYYKDHSLGTIHEATAYAASEQFKTLPSAQAKGITEGTVPVTAHVGKQSVQEMITPGSKVQGKTVTRVMSGEELVWNRSVAQEEINSAATFDFLIGQADRRDKNMLIAETDDGSHHLVSIDNGHTFPTSSDGGHHVWQSPEEGGWGHQSFVYRAEGNISDADRAHIASTFSDKFIDSLPLRNTVKNGMKARRDFMVKAKNFKEMAQFQNRMKRELAGRDIFEA